MTQNQSTILVKNPNTKKAMAVLTKFAELEATYKALEKEAKEATELIKEAMIAGGVNKVTIDMPGWEGYITLAERTTYSAEDIEAVDEKYLKPTLDTAKVKAEATLTGTLPSGVAESKTQYITKKIKAVE
jgi:hypothetical protein